MVHKVGLTSKAVKAGAKEAVKKAKDITDTAVKKVVRKRRTKIPERPPYKEKEVVRPSDGFYSDGGILYDKAPDKMPKDLNIWSWNINGLNS